MVYYVSERKFDLCRGLVAQFYTLYFDPNEKLHKLEL